MKQSITYGEYAGPDGELVTVAVIPPDATPEEIEALVMQQGAAAMTDEPADAVDALLNEGVTRRGVAR